MYKYTKEQVLEPAFLTKLIDQFKTNEIPVYMKHENYYKVKTKILNRSGEDGKPNNKLAHGFCRYITNMATSYFAGKPIRLEYDSSEEIKDMVKEFKEAIETVFNNNHKKSLDFDVSKEASKKGVGYYLLFVNEKSEIRIKKMDAESIIPIYSPSLDEFLEVAIRIWSVFDIDGKLLYDYADIYDETYIYHYIRENGAMIYAKCEAYMTPHMLSDVPVIVVWNNEDCMGDFEPIITLNDAYDNGQSDTCNDLDYFSDAYLCIVGATDLLEVSLTDSEADGEGEKKAVNTLRKNRLLFLDEKGQAYFITKPSNDQESEHFKDRLYKDIFFLSQVPCISDENFAGNLSGIAIKYKLIALEELAIQKENKSESAQQKMLQIITNFLNTKMNKSWNPDWITLKYTRNIVENLTDLINDAKNLEGIVSKETQLKSLPTDIVDDVMEEMDRIREESLAAEQLPKVDINDL